MTFKIEKVKTKASTSCKISIQRKTDVVESSSLSDESNEELDKEVVQQIEFNELPKLPPLTDIDQQVILKNESPNDMINTPE